MSIRPKRKRRRKPLRRLLKLQPQHKTRSIFRVIPRYSAAIVSCRAETPQHAQISASFCVIPRPSFPAKANNHTNQQLPPARQEPRPPKGGLLGRCDRQRRQQNKTRSIFRVIPRHSAAIISHQAETPHKTLNFPRHSASFRVIPRPSFPTEPKHHTTRSIFRVIPRHSAAIISRRAETPHNTLNFPRHSASFRGHHFPPTATPTHNTLKFPRHSALFRGHHFPPSRNTTQHAQFSASFRGHHLPPRRNTTQAKQLPPARQEPRPPKETSTSQDDTTANRNNNTKHAQFSASFRVIPRPSIPQKANNHTTSAARQEPRPPKAPHPPKGASPSQRRPARPQTPRPPTGTSPNPAICYTAPPSADNTPAAATRLYTHSPEHLRARRRF